MGTTLEITAAGLLLLSTGVAAETTPQATDSKKCSDYTPETLAIGEDAVVGEVILERQQVFDTTLPEEDKALFRLANRYHILTRPSTIRSQLLFTRGERYSQRLLEESERLLRRRAYLYDATIRPLSYHDGVVDICVTTRDVWSLTPDLSIKRSGGENETYVEIEEQNIGGSGAAITLAHSSNVDRDSTSFNFRDAQLRQSRVALTVGLAENSDGDRKELLVNRPFYALDARWSAGVRFMQDDRISTLYDLGNEVVEYRHDRLYAQTNYGWSQGLKQGWVQRWSVGVILDRNQFHTTPVLTGPLPVDRKLAYPYAAYERVQDKFAKATNLNQIGRTEDIFLGSRFAASLGWSHPRFGADGSALIFSAEASSAYGTPSDELWQLQSSLSGRGEHSGLNNTVLHASVRRFLHQSERRLFFASVSADVGHDLDLDNPLQLGGNTGLRGYPLRYQSGDTRIVFKAEQRYFSDWYPLRLARVGGAIFADIGRTWGVNPVGGPSLGWLKNVGFGLRLASTRSGSGKILHFDVAFPLDGDAKIDNVQFLVESHRGF